MNFTWVHGAIGTGGLLVGLAATGLVGLSGNALGTRFAVDDAPDMDLIEAPIEMELVPEGEDLGPLTYEIVIDGIHVDNQAFSSITEVALDGGGEEPEGNEPDHPDREPTGGPTELVLERDFMGIDEFYRWRMDVEGGAIERHNVTITVLAADGRRVETIELLDAWPRVWETPDMIVGDEVENIETITLLAEETRRREY